MRIPTLRGVIERRILANFRVDPDVLAKLLPSPFRPQLVDGRGIAGICLIRLKQIRPRFTPALLGISSENAAHRIAVEWDENEETNTGVYIPRRDTSSRLNTLLGGRLFPGVHHHARFAVREHGDDYSVIMDSDDDGTRVAVEGHLTSDLPEGSVFGSIQDASDFFRCGSLGYSDTGASGTYDGLELRTVNWNVESLAVDRVESSFFADSRLFPAGSVEFDCALLMRNIKHEWHRRPQKRSTVSNSAA
ncbi:MAG: DUF2071 domain-containing protein [Pirellulales bacterium]